MVSLSRQTRNTVAPLVLIGVAIGFVALFPDEVEPSIIVETFKALAQIGGVLIGLVGIVGVFGLRAFLDSIRDADKRIDELAEKTSSVPQEKPKASKTKLHHSIRGSSSESMMYRAIGEMLRREGRFYLHDLFFSLMSFVFQVLLAILGIAYSNNRGVWSALLVLSTVGLLWGCYWTYSLARIGSGL